MSAVATRPRLGFAGLGWIGRNRLEAIAATGAAEIAAVADPRGCDLDVPCLDSFEELLTYELDGLVIATPSALHAEQAIAALERGLAVFCQKPLGRDAGETRAVVEAARVANRLLGVDLSYRCTDAARRLREEVRSGSLGRIYSVELVFHNAYGPDKPWFYDRKLSGGGCLIDLGVHLADLALWALDYPPTRVASARLLSPRGLDVEEVAFAELEIGGASVRLACSWGLPAGVDCLIEASFYGTEGGVSLRNVDGSFYDIRADRLRGTQRETLASSTEEWGGRAAQDWSQRLARGERFDPEAERLVTVAQLLDAIYRAARCAS
ncbi:MAG: Gfo/Idh/MocA family oxidoreductase [Actinobacteria bacterium]|nr:Gfo/Idh/MocA family oxidoreductase [Actinomycetota bacterium]MDQ3163131.1 Gfo/Idh/MocA family oxidoreductase [Actinomycetota bacterium]